MGIVNGLNIYMVIFINLKSVIISRNDQYQLL